MPALPVCDLARKRRVENFFHLVIRHVAVFAAIDDERRRRGDRVFFGVFQVIGVKRLRVVGIRKAAVELGVGEACGFADGAQLIDDVLGRARLAPLALFAVDDVGEVSISAASCAQAGSPASAPVDARARAASIVCLRFIIWFRSLTFALRYDIGPQPFKGCAQVTVLHSLGRLPHLGWDRRGGAGLFRGRIELRTPVGKTRGGGLCDPYFLHGGDIGAHDFGPVGQKARHGKTARFAARADAGCSQRTGAFEAFHAAFVARFVGRLLSCHGMAF